jgi:hypothetical protein
MPATSLKQIYNFEGPFQRAFKEVMEAAGYGNVFLERSLETLPQSRIEPIFAGGNAINEEVRPDGTHVYDFFEGRLAVRIVTDRPDNQPSIIPGVMDLHEEYAAAVRAEMEERRNPFNETNLPFYAVKTIRPLATTRDMDPRWMEDYTRLEFFVQFGIRSDQWPTGS